MSIIKINIQKNYKFIVLSALLLTSLSSASMFTTKASANEVYLLQSLSINNAEVSYRYGWGAALANIAGQALGIRGQWANSI